MIAGKKGFTLIELMIVLFILTILTGIAVLTFRSSLAKSRDAEREADVSGISTALKSYAKTKTNTAAGSGRGLYIETGLLSMGAEDLAKEYLPDLDRSLLFAPERDKEGSMSLVPATNTNTNPAQVLPKPTEDTYVYQPLRKDNSLCTSSSDDCTHFNVFYKREKPSEDCVGSPKIYCVVHGEAL